MTASPPNPDHTGAYRARRRRGGGWVWWVLGLLALLIIVGIVLAIVLPGDHHKKATAAPPAVVETSRTANSQTSLPGASTPGSTASASGGSTGSRALVGGGGLAPVTATGGEAGSGVAGTVLFASNSAELDASADKVIAGAATLLKARRAPMVRVTGYTDTVAGTPTNDPLSQQRADAVAARLRVLLPGVAVTTSAVGEADPVATNSTVAGRAQNRRAVISGVA